MRQMELEEQALARPPLLGVATIAVFAVLLIGALAFLASQHWSGAGSRDSASGASFANAGEVEVLEGIQARVRREEEGRQRLDRTLALTQVDAMLEESANIRVDLTAARKGFAEWDALVPALLVSEAGKRVAGDPKQAQAFEAIYRRTARPDQSAIDGIELRLATIEAELQNVKSSEDAVLPKDGGAQLHDRLEQERSAARLIREGVRRDLDSVQAIVAGTTSTTPAAATLQQALDDLIRKRAEERAGRMAAEVARVNQEQDQLDTAMEGEKLADIREAERQLRAAALTDEAVRKKTEADAAERQTKEDDLTRRAESVIVQANYRPFLLLGKTQPVNKNPAYGTEHCYWQEVPGLEKKPASHAALKAAKAFERLEVFIALATSASNDREGAWPALNPAGDEKTLAEYRKRWEEFQELAPYWIRMGKLGQ